MSLSSLALTIAKHPAVRRYAANLAKKAAVGGIRALGRSRQRRANAGRYYVGKRLGIPPRRQPTVSSLATTTTRTVAPNVGQQMSKMQVPISRVETGSESLGTCVAVEDFMVNGFGMLYSAAINPAEPSIFPCLSAIANQYQRFVTRGLTVTFTPSSSTTVSGQVYLAFVPKADQADPTSISDFETFLGTQKGLIYGAATKLVISPQQLQQSYRIQQVEKVESIGEDSTPLNSSGRLFVAINGADSSVYNKVVGTLTCSYSYEFSTRQLTQGSNALHCDYSIPVANGVAADISTAYLNSGHHMLVPDDVLECYRLRAPNGCTVDGSFYFGNSTNENSIAFEGSHDGTNWTAIPILLPAETAAHVRTGLITFKYCPYLRITMTGTSNDQLHLRLHTI